MSYLFLREAGGLGDILQLGSAAQVLATVHQHVDLWTISDPSICELARMIPSFQSVHPLRLVVSKRRQRGDQNYNNYEYLRPAMYSLVLEPTSVLVDMFCPAAEYEMRCVRSDALPALSRAQCFVRAVSSLSGVSDTAPVVLHPPENGKDIVALVQGKLRSTFSVINLTSKDISRSFVSASASKLIRDLVASKGAAVVWDYPETQQKYWFESPDVFWYPKDCGFPVSRELAVDHLFWLMTAAARAVCVDSFPMHMALTVGIPTAVLCGPTNPEVLTAHYRHELVLPVVNDKELPCAWCYYQTSRGFVSTCHDIGCRRINSLTAERVLAAMREIS